MNEKQRNATVEKICKSLENGASIVKACEAAHITHVTFWMWRKKFPEIESKVDAVVDARNQVVEDALFKDCLTKGNTVAKIFYLKNRSPKRWSDRRELDLGNKDGQPLGVVDYSKLKDSEVSRALLERLRNS